MMYDRNLPKGRARNAYQRFATAKQRVGESAADFLSRVVKLRKDTGQDLSDEEVINTVKEGLISREYKMAIITNGSNISQVMETLKELDSLDKDDRVTKPYYKQPKLDERPRFENRRRQYAYQLDNERNDKSNNFTRDFKPRGSRFSRPPYYRGRRPFDPAAKAGRFNCWNCGMSGHVARFCRNNHNKLGDNVTQLKRADRDRD